MRDYQEETMETAKVLKTIIEDTKSDKLIKAVLGTIAGFAAKQVVEDG